MPSAGFACPGSGCAGEVAVGLEWALPMECSFILGYLPLSRDIHRSPGHPELPSHRPCASHHPAMSSKPFTFLSPLCPSPGVVLFPRLFPTAVSRVSRRLHGPIPVGYSLGAGCFSHHVSLPGLSSSRHFHDRIHGLVASCVSNSSQFQALILPLCLLPAAGPWSSRGVIQVGFHGVTRKRNVSCPALRGHGGKSIIQLLGASRFCPITIFRPCLH